jgi:hypothetical protein
LSLREDPSVIAVEVKPSKATSIDLDASLGIHIASHKRKEAFLVVQNPSRDAIFLGLRPCSR